MKRLFYFSLNSLWSTPYPEAALPALTRDGWEITLAGRDASQAVYRHVLPYPVKEVIDVPSAARSLNVERIIAKILWKARFGAYDVIYINSVMGAVRGAIHLLGPKFGKKIVYHNPDYYCPFNHPWYFYLEGRYCRMSDLYINNEFHRGYITQALHRTKCPTITAPPNLPRAWPVPAKSAEKRALMAGGRDDAFVFMLHGGWGPLRMVPELCKGLSMLPARFRLVMTGGAKKGDAVDVELNKMGLADRVVRLPRLSFSEMLEYTVNADAGVLIYQNNDLGNFFTAPGRMTEYLNCGLPVLGSNHTGIENLILRYDFGVTTNAPDPQDIVRSIELLAARTAAGDFPAAKMRQLFLDHFAFDHWEPVVVKAMNDALESKSSHTNSRPQYPWLPNP